MQECIHQWIDLDYRIKQHMVELEQLRIERQKVLDKIYLYVKEEKLMNKKVKTTSGKTYIFRERNSFSNITLTYLKDILQKLFSQKKSLTPDSIYDFIVANRSSKKYFEIEKK